MLPSELLLAFIRQALYLFFEFGLTALKQV